MVLQMRILQKTKQKTQPYRRLFHNNLSGKLFLPQVVFIKNTSI